MINLLVLYLKTIILKENILFDLYNYYTFKLIYNKKYI